MKAIERLKGLEEQGVALSRNRHFQFFSEPENERALALKRYLDGIIQTIRDGMMAGAMTAELGVDEHGRLALTLTRTDLAARHVAHLSVEEFERLVTDADVADFLKGQGISWT